jgi:hypothetical protein
MLVKPCQRTGWSIVGRNVYIPSILKSLRIAGFQPFAITTLLLVIWSRIAWQYCCLISLYDGDVSGSSCDQYNSRSGTAICFANESSSVAHFVVDGHRAIYSTNVPSWKQCECNALFKRMAAYSVAVVCPREGQKCRHSMLRPFDGVCTHGEFYTFTTRSQSVMRFLVSVC